jgi:RHS repeat-associated protein
MAQGSIDSYTYNARSELISARRTKNGQPIPGFSEDFDYDPIGNRRSSATYNEKGEAQTSTYQANNLNQYTMRTTPGYAAVRGEAAPEATVTVNENPAFRLGSYYFGSDLFDNSSSGGLANLETYATLAQTAANGDESEDLVSATTNQVYIAQSPESFAYDDDGNQTLITTKTGLWRVTYNGENRPILWVRDSDNTTIVMSYDHKGRRREKNDQRFFYDAYLQVADNGGNVYTWDCTEPVATRPLAWHRGNSSDFYTHDGNKNVSEVIAAVGAFAAHYEYAPFGAVTTQFGALVVANPWRFSGEYADDDTATVYYNYRHYDPVTGRWLNDDPFGEIDGPALRMFVGNFVDRQDYLGLWKAESGGGSRRIYEKEDGDTIAKLAGIVELDEAESEFWAKKLDVNGCRVSVPNVWIDADLLQGPCGLYDHIVNIGGTIGSFVLTDLGVWGKKIVKVNDVEGLRTALSNSANDLWGLQVFAHGGASGEWVCMPDGRRVSQDEIISYVRAGGYRIAYAYMMQCYSAANGYGGKWGRAAINFYGYYGMNVFGFDMGGGYWPWNWNLFQ